MSGFADLLLGLGLFMCAVAIVIIGAVGLEMMRCIDSSDRSLVRWLCDVCGCVRAICLRTIELLSCQRQRSGPTVADNSPVVDVMDDSGAYESSPSGTVGDIPLTSRTQVISFFFFIFYGHAVGPVRHHIRARVFCSIFLLLNLKIFSFPFVSLAVCLINATRKVRGSPQSS